MFAHCPSSNLPAYLLVLFVFSMKGGYSLPQETFVYHIPECIAYMDHQPEKEPGSFPDTF